MDVKAQLLGALKLEALFMIGGSGEKKVDEVAPMSVTPLEEFLVAILSDSVLVGRMSPLKSQAVTLPAASSVRRLRNPARFGEESVIVKESARSKVVVVNDQDVGWYVPAPLKSIEVIAETKSFRVKRVVPDVRVV